MATLKTIYSAFVIPHLSYGIEVWHSAYKNVTEPIFVLQKKAIRAVFKLDYLGHTGDSFRTAGFLKLRDLYRINLLSVFFKHINGNPYTFLNNSLIHQFSIHGHVTRDAQLLRLPAIKREKTRQSPLYAGITLWNSVCNSSSVSHSSYYSFRKSFAKNCLNDY